MFLLSSHPQEARPRALAQGRAFSCLSLLKDPPVKLFARDRFEGNRQDGNPPLLWLADKDPLTLADLFPGVSVLGQAGSGKTSGLITLAIPLLLMGCGFVWLCAKPDEAGMLWRLVKATRREKQFVLFGQDIDRDTGVPLVDRNGQPVMTGHRFNALDYESRRSGGTLSLVHYLAEIASSLNKGRSQGREESPFWKEQFEMLLAYCIDVATLADLVVSVGLLRDIQKSAPRDRGELDSREWQETSVLMQALRRIEARVEAGEVAEVELGRCLDFWLKDYFRLDEKPRSIIDVMMAALVNLYARDPVRTLLTTSTTFTPEDVMAGAVVCLNLPTRTFFEPGRLAQFHFKYSYQRSVLEQARLPIPCVLWGDEYHNFVADFDAEFFAEARSRQSITVALEQGIGGYKRALGLSDRRDVDAFLANLTVKLFFGNSSVETNEYAAEVFARELAEMESGGSGSGNGYGPNVNTGWQQQEQYQVRPVEFTRLKSGGGSVEAFVYRRGQVFHATGANWLKTAFRQTEFTR